MARSTYAFEDADNPGQIWDVADIPPELKAMRVYSFAGFVYAFEVEFTDATEANLEVIKRELTKKYAGKGDGLTDTLFGEGRWNAVIDGVKVSVMVNRDMGFMEDDKLELRYTHRQLQELATEELKRRKAERIGGEL